jgi:hypothetical protein
MLPIIKFNSVKDLHTARYAAGMGVSFLGVCTDKTRDGFLSPSQLSEIVGWISGPAWVAELVNWPLEEGYSFDMVEVNDLVLAQKIADQYPLIFVVELEKGMIEPTLLPKSEYVMIKKTGQLSEEEMAYTQQLTQKHRVMLSCLEGEKFFSSLGCVGFAFMASSVEQAGTILDLFEQ